ncbi:MAG: Imm30 family immunity protein [Bacteroidota bacterium]
MLDILIDDLKDIVSRRSEDTFVIKFEKKLEEIHATQNPAMISKLLDIMDDKFEFDELMFSIIHTVESFDDFTYIQELFISMPDFVLKSPRWASIIVMRIINSSQTLEVFLDTLEILSSKKKEVLKLLLNSMAKRGDEIEKRVTPVLNVLNNDNVSN